MSKLSPIVDILRDKRKAEGYSLRALSGIIGVSFSTLARLERGDGEPDSNTKVRILDWLGKDAERLNVTLEEVAFVHFRAAKNISSKVTSCLLKTALHLQGSDSNGFADIFENEEFLADIPKSLSKDEMEGMAEKLRSDLNLSLEEKFDSLTLDIEGVDVFTPQDLSFLSEDCLKTLLVSGKDEWSAMSVPLDSERWSWAVIRNTEHSIERQRVTYLEECWHIMLGHKPTKVAKVGSAYGRTYESSEEHDAFFLATASLLPKGIVTKQVEQGRTSSQIAKMFEVSNQLVEYRIKRLGLWRSYKQLKVTLSQ